MKEIWKDIPELKGRYQCSNLGRVRRVNKDIRSSAYKILKLQKVKSQYISVNPTTQYRRSVHRIVAELFTPNPEGKPCVNHINFNRSDNRVVNLEWVTHSENSLHSEKHGRLKRNCWSVQNIETGEIYEAIKLAALRLGVNYKFLCKKLAKPPHKYNNLIRLEKAHKNLSFKHGGEAL